MYIHTHLELRTLCGLTTRISNQGSLGLGGLVCEEAHPRFLVRLNND